MSRFHFSAWTSAPQSLTTYFEVSIAEGYKRDDVREIATVYLWVRIGNRNWFLEYVR